MTLETYEMHLSENRFQDGTSSIYSRSPDSPKLSLSPDLLLRSLSPKHDLPEINSLDHQIALAKGSTIALETTKTHMQSWKTRNRLSIPELREEKLRQWEQQENENRFYCMCRDIFQDLCTAVTESSEYLIRYSQFEPEASPVNNERVLKAVKTLGTALEHSRTREALAEQEWRKQWNANRICNPTARWI
jgi:hypothetical protein